MNDKQRAKLAMFQTTLLVLKEHTGDYTANKALTAAVGAFQTEVDLLDPEHQARRPESGGLTLVKKKTRARVVLAAHNIGAALFAFAADPAREDLPLQAAVDYTQRTLERQSDADLIRISALILTKGTEHATNLKDLDVAATDLTELRDAITQFKAEQAAPRAARSEGAADTKELACYYREAQALLVSQIDRQLARYEAKAPAFFAAYQSARKPNATAGRSAKPAPTPG
ncbi:hypothetical protein GCM10022409_26950 [Hymenobacter glaciei]|uniref:Uncharacterized protein n=1 Tax=Hymenobacter glaciei TaxID=877209 RepID=A0ABP7UBH8_9BACT